MSLFNDVMFNAGMFNGPPVVGFSSDDVISFNKFGMQNGAVVTASFKDDNPPDKVYDTHNFPRGNGRIFVDSHQEVKKIPVKGTIKANTNAEFVQLIRDMKKAFRADNGVLKKTESNIFVQYIANLVRLNIPRESWNTTYSEFMADFEVFEPYGFDEFRNVKTQTIITGAFTEELIHDGNVDEARLITTFIIDADDTISEISYTNTATGETITITTPLVTGDILTINGETEEVKKNGVDVKFAGVIPTLKVGPNPFTGTVTSVSHNIIATNKFYNYFS